MPRAASLASDLVTVTARITDRGKGIGRIEWRVNGITPRLRHKPTGSGPDYIVTQQLALDPGDNTSRWSPTTPATCWPRCRRARPSSSPARRDPTKPKLHILAIGINAYGKDVASASSPGRKDAETFAADMKKAAASQYGEVHVTWRWTSRRHANNLDKIVGRSRARSTRAIPSSCSLAGHGISDDGRYYLIPQDYQGGPVA